LVELWDYPAATRRTTMREKTIGQQMAAEHAADLRKERAAERQDLRDELTAEVADDQDEATPFSHHVAEADQKRAYAAVDDFKRGVVDPNATARVVAHGRGSEILFDATENP
jgi:hypothetical protein